MKSLLASLLVVTVFSASFCVKAATTPDLPPVVAVVPATPSSAPIPVIQSAPITVQGTSTQTLWLAAIAGITTLLGTIFTGLMTYFMARLNKQVETATVVAKAGVERGEVLISKTDKTLQVVNAVHTLVNHEMHVALQTIATLSHDRAEKSKLPADVDAADKADKAVADHDAGQAKLDAEKLQAAKQQETPQRREGDKAA